MTSESVVDEKGVKGEGEGTEETEGDKEGYTVSTTAVTSTVLSTGDGDGIEVEVIEKEGTDKTAEKKEEMEVVGEEGKEEVEKVVVGEGSEGSEGTHKNGKVEKDGAGGGVYQEGETANTGPVPEDTSTDPIPPAKAYSRMESTHI